MFRLLRCSGSLAVSGGYADGLRLWNWGWLHPLSVSSLVGFYVRLMGLGVDLDQKLSGNSIPRPSKSPEVRTIP